MAEFIPIHMCKVYNARQHIDLSRCKELLRFDNVSIDFVAAKFLIDHDTKGGGLSKQN